MRTVRNERLGEGRDVPLCKLCVWLGAPRATAYYEQRLRQPCGVDSVPEIPTLGIRRVWEYLRFRLKVKANRKQGGADHAA